MSEKDKNIPVESQPGRSLARGSVPVSRFTQQNLAKVENLRKVGGMDEARLVPLPASFVDSNRQSDQGPDRRTVKPPGSSMHQTMQKPHVVQFDEAAGSRLARNQAGSCLIYNYHQDGY